jgi:hypothetical protein
MFRWRSLSRHLLLCLPVATRTVARDAARLSTLMSHAILGGASNAYDGRSYGVLVRT